jgi:hypothetical protein
MVHFYGQTWCSVEELCVAREICHFGSSALYQSTCTPIAISERVYLVIKDICKMEEKQETTRTLCEGSDIELRYVHSYSLRISANGTMPI